MTENATRRAETNEERRARRVRREIQKQHNWRVSTWAKAIKYIEQRQKELTDLGFNREELFEPDFTNPSLVDSYADLTRPE